MTSREAKRYAYLKAASFVRGSGAGEMPDPSWSDCDLRRLDKAFTEIAESLERRADRLKDAQP